jgi:putative endonuclease
MYYVYVLRSKKDKKNYTGYTSNLKKRMEEHQNGNVESTKYRRPFDLVYFEGCLDSKDARRREIYLKTTYGKRFIKNRIKNYLIQIESIS